MSDITERLRRWTHAVDAVPASDLMDEAANEIDRLRSQPCPYVQGTVTRYCTLSPLTLTDAERGAVAVAMHRCEGPVFRQLRGLLERLK